MKKTNKRPRSTKDSKTIKTTASTKKNDEINEENQITRKRRHSSDDPLCFHSDWPAPDKPIDLKLHDLPHSSSDTEWWYFNCHLKVCSKTSKINKINTFEKGHELSAFLSFFRLFRDIDSVTNEARYAHAICWSISDPISKEYISTSFLDRDAPNIIMAHLESGDTSDSMKIGKTDKRLVRALKEMCEHKSVPLPDQIFPKESFITTKPNLKLDFGGQTLHKLDNGSYKVNVSRKNNGFRKDNDKNENEQVILQLVFTPKKIPIRHGHDGITQIGRRGDEMFYYFIPYCEVSGTIVYHGTKITVEGQGWYDHEFGGAIRTGLLKQPTSNNKILAPAPIHYAWTWFAFQLNNNIQLTATLLINPNDNKIHDNFIVFVDESGNRTEYSDVTITEGKTWRSARTFQDYPIEWKMIVPSCDIKLDILASFSDQEFITLIAEPCFWEGRLTVKGTIAGVKVAGLGFCERHGYADFSSLAKFYKRVSLAVIKQVDNILPHNCSQEQMDRLLEGQYGGDYSLGIDVKKFQKTIIEPIRSIIDRGGKAWRSHASMLCVDCVGGDSRPIVDWLALPEILHVGSLMIDDIQDKSETRRGGKSAHLMHGEAVTINSGCASFFIVQAIVQDADFPIDVKIKIYELYFQALRAGHVGQGLDIHGLHDMMPQCVTTGNGKKIEESVCAIHKLKSALPAGNLARMGSIIGKGTTIQTKALGAFFEALGVAFQIMDDVLNLRGLRSEKGSVTKDIGEDIREGKITFPVAHAISVLNFEERKKLWSTLSCESPNQRQVTDIINLLENKKVLDSSIKYATDMINDAWNDLNPVIPDSFYKALLRAFAFFVLERHY